MEIYIPLVSDSANSYPEDKRLVVRSAQTNSNIRLELDDRVVVVSKGQLQRALDALDEAE